MAGQQLGNVMGVVNVGPSSPKICEITADGVGTVTVGGNDIGRLYAGQSFDIINKATGAVLANNYTVLAIDGFGVLTYVGADVAAVPGTHALYHVNGYALDSKTNLNGGGSAEGPLWHRAYAATEQMKTRLKAISGLYTDARLNAMTYNDLVYALRVLMDPASVK